MFKSLILKPLTATNMLIRVNNRILNHAGTQTNRLVITRVSNNPYIQLEHKQLHTLADSFKTGTLIGTGQFGQVRLIGTTNKVLKKYFNHGVEKQMDLELKGFLKYYGDGSAKIITDNDGGKYLEMDMINGENLRAFLEKNTIPSNIDLLFSAMIEKLKQRGIYHSDLTESNIMFTGSEFCPIDIVDRSDITDKTPIEIDREYDQILETIKTRYSDKKSTLFSFLSLLKDFNKFA